MKYAVLVCAAFAIASPAQVPDPILSGPRTAWPLDRVVHDAPGDGRLWACGTDWKASFGADGFTFVPFLPGARRNLPLQFRIARVGVGDRELPIAAVVAPRRAGDRVTFDRGAVHEVYDLSLAHVEQSFVIDTSLPGDVVLELAVATELREDGSRPGLQFACEHGAVDYGEAFVVRNGAKAAIATEWTGSSLRMSVPAHLRGDGPVVIDPILSTRTVGSTATHVRVDGAYDVTFDRYLVVWEHVWSVTDHDIWTMMFDGAGDPIPGSGLAVDVSSTNFTYPRTANLNDSNRFLITAEVADPFYGRQMIWGRTRDAFGAMSMNIAQILSDPNEPGDNQAADVGADPATGPGNHDWIVVWTNRTAAGTRIFARPVLGTGVPRHTVNTTVQGGNDAVDDVQVSRSNGNGYVPHPMWCVVYTRNVGSYKHVLGRNVDPNGFVGPELPLVTGNATHADPQVSSPIADGTRTRFLVTYEVSGTAQAMVVAFSPAWHSTHYMNLTTLFGLLPGQMRADSDGARFVVGSKAQFAGAVDVSILGWDLGALVPLGTATLSGGITGWAEPQIASCRGSGGEPGHYAVAFLQGAASSRTPALTRFGGYTFGATSDVLATACQGSTLALSMAGSPYLGAALTFTLSGYGADFPLIAFGGANANAVPICPDCALGLRLDLPIHLFGGSSATLTIPSSASFVGATFAMQGVALGVHQCLGGLEFGDTIRFTIR